MIDPSVLLIALCVIAVVVGAIVFMRNQKPPALTNAGDGAQPAKVTSGGGNRMHFRLGDKAKPLLAIAHREANGASPTDFGPDKRVDAKKLPEELKRNLHQLLMKAASQSRAPLSEQTSWYELDASRDLVDRIDGSIESPPSEIATIGGAPLALAIWQAWKLVERPNELDRADMLLRKLSIDADGLEKSAIDLTIRRDVQNAYAYAATSGPSLIDQSYTLDAIPIHRGQFTKLTRDLAGESDDLSKRVDEFDNYFANLNFARLGHKSRVGHLKEPIEKYAAMMSAASLLIETRCTLLLLKHALPMSQEKRNRELAELISESRDTLDKTQTLRIGIESRLPELSSFMGGFLRNHHERQRKELSTMLHELLTPIEVRLADVIGTMQSNLDEDAEARSAADSTALQLLLYSNADGINEVKAVTKKVL
jgi:hypothetical protein